MIFTREPLLETIITAREGTTLLVKNSKQEGEEYSVDAVEVVSLGQCFFFRSLEKPKAFLVPVSDYTVVEVKQTRVVLKSTLLEKSVRISPTKEVEKAFASSAENGDVEKASDKKKERRRHRKKRSSEEGTSEQSERTPLSEGLDKDQARLDSGEPYLDTPPSESESVGEGSTENSSFLNTVTERSQQREGKKPAVLLPPPDGLIADTLRKAKPEALEKNPTEGQPQEESKAVSGMNEEDGSTFSAFEMDQETEEKAKSVNHLRSDKENFMEVDGEEEPFTKENPPAKGRPRFIFPFQGDVF